MPESYIGPIFQQAKAANSYMEALFLQFENLMLE